MTRLEQAEAMARVMANLQPEDDWTVLPNNGRYTRVSLLELAGRMLDVTHPQITTAEQLQQLPTDTLLVADDGPPFQWADHLDADVILRAFGTPLTVLWRP